MTMLVATPQATIHPNTVAAAINVSRATSPGQGLAVAPDITKPNTDARPVITRWYDDPNALRGL